MADPSSKIVIFAALVGNGLIAVTKFAAAAYTGSSAMFSEAIHSVVDTGNQILLLYGIRRSNRPPDAMHPFGYGMELYFWAFLVAILVFAAGAGFSFLEGINKVRAPNAIENPEINYIVLGLAAIFESVAWWFAFREFRTRKGDLSFIAAVRRSKDPTVFTVLFEDTAALLGLGVAALGIFLGQQLQIPEMDGIASIVIAVILATTATLLAYECKGLLVGESADPDIVSRIDRILDADRRIKRVNEVLTMHLGPKDILLNVSIDFVDGISANEVEETISVMERRLKHEYPEINRVFIEAQSWTAHRRSQRR